MKKKILKHLNDEWQKAIVEVVNKEFGDIGFTTSFNIFDMAYVSNWKLQGIRKDREIKSFVKGVEAGYVKAIEFASKL